MIKKFIFYFLTIVITLTIAILILEFFFKFKYYYKINQNSDLKNFMVSPRIYNPDYGWELKKNFEYSYITSDNDIINKKTNNLGLASQFDLDLTSDKFKILIIGDSFTESLGVDTKKSWPNQLQTLLIENSYKNVEIYNGAIAGYNLDQYYFRLKDLNQKIQPNLIIIALATATDFYDVGKFYKNFVYGSNIGRNYFEIKEGELEINSELNSIENIDNTTEINIKNENLNLLQHIKKILEYSRLYEMFKKSNFVVKLAANLRYQQISLWPSTEIGIAKKNSKIEKKKLYLIEKILKKISDEFSISDNLFLVHIPYKVEVDEEFWESTFKKLPEKYDQNGPEKKIKNLIFSKNFKFIPLVDKFKIKINNEKENLYLKNDGHLNQLGNFYVSETVFENIEKFLPKKN